MKKYITIILTLSLTPWLPLAGQGLVTGNADVVGLTGYPYYSQFIESGPESFFWLSGSYLSSVDHPMLGEVNNDFLFTYFIKYDKEGNPLYSNYIQGTCYPIGAFSYNGGLTIMAQAYADVTTNTGAVVPLNLASETEFLARYDERGQFLKIAPIWDLGGNQNVNSTVQMDKGNGSVFVSGISNEPLNVFGHGVIGSDLGHFLYVLKFDSNLNLAEVFTAGMETGGEYGYYQNYPVLIPDHRGGVIVTGTWEGDLSPVIGENALTGVGFDSQGVYAFKLGPSFDILWVRDGTLRGFDYDGNSMLFKGFPMSNGDMIFTGVTTTGHFSLGEAEVDFAGGSGYQNQFAFRVDPEGKVKWIRPLYNMAEAYYEGKKSASSASRPRDVQSDQFRESLDWDAIQWNEEILYMTGYFLNDSLVVAGRRLDKPFFNGIFVTATDANTGEELWGYAISSSYVGLHGFDLDAGGNVALMGTTNYLKNYEFKGLDSTSSSSPVFHLGLSYEGQPLWRNNAVMLGQGYGGYGTDLLVLRDGEVFSSLSKYLPDPMEVGGTTLSSNLNYSAMVVALDVGNVLGGTLLTSESMPVTSGQLKAYKRTASGAYPMVDSIAVAGDGTYEFAGLYPGKYILLATPGEGYAGSVPTYSGGAVAWDEAKMVDIEADTRFRSQYINLAWLPPLTSEDGSGQMGGNVSYEDEPVLGKGTLGKPATKTSVVLKRRAAQQQKSAMEDDVVAYVETDDQGNYVFEHVPDGDYVLHVDIAGLPMVQTYDVVIVGNEIVYGLDFVVKKDGIEATNPVAVEETVKRPFAVYPNPASHLLSIDFPDVGAYQLRVYNSGGALILYRDLPLVSGTVMLDVSSWSRGVYLVEIESETGRETVKFLRD